MIMKLHFDNQPLSLTSRFSGVWGGQQRLPNRFNGFGGARETAEAVHVSVLSRITPLKRDFNERRCRQIVTGV